MKKGILIGIMLLIFAGNLLANDALRLKDTLGQPGMLWEWDHNNKYWSGYIASSTEPSWTVIAAGPSAKLGKWFTIFYGGLKIDQSDPKLKINGAVLETFHKISLCKDQIGDVTLLRFDAFLTLSREGKDKSNLAFWAHVLERLGPHYAGGQIMLSKDSNASSWSLGPRLEYFFNKNVKVVGVLGVNIKSPHQKSCLVDVWAMF
ncbi:MAG: hypothetical protein CEO40_264 [Parcubacteria group bacterium LiPW_72]|nr:MAG: hypothetical protein CEO40_264 [Parcubacteria group bacterium LiPW_72]